jgi:hypothetical protein
MSFGLRRIALAAVAAFALGGAAQAAEVSITIHTDGHGTHRRVADYGEKPFAGSPYRRTEHWYEHREPGRYYGRPVPDWREGRPYRDGYTSAPVVERHHWQRPVFAGPRWTYQDTCKIIIKERVNRWGELVQVRSKVCR